MALDALSTQTRPPEQILLVDNGGGRIAKSLADYPSVEGIVPDQNLGYPHAVNLAAAAAVGDYLMCMNPDATADSECLERLIAAADSDPRIALAGAQILLDDWRTCNAGANPVHPIGISPAGGYGEPREYGASRDVLVVSGACCLIRREPFLALGGFVDEFFLYYDDVDLGWRVNIAGHRVLYEPEATVAHSYEFARRGRKWMYLERNRLFTVLSNYERRTLLLLAPLLLASEAGLLVVAAAQGWLSEKLRAYASLLSLYRRVLVQRRAVAGYRQKSDRELFELFDPRLDSMLIPRYGARVANLVAIPYLRCVRRLL
jgi:GT2 family glycosyltransferase